MTFWENHEPLNQLKIHCKTLKETVRLKKRPIITYKTITIVQFPFKTSQESKAPEIWMLQESTSKEVFKKDSKHHSRYLKSRFSNVLKIPLDVKVHQGWFNNARHFWLAISVEFVCMFIANNWDVKRQASVHTVNKPLVVWVRVIMVYHGWWNRCIVVYSFL